MSLRSRAVMVKKCTKKACCTCKDANLLLFRRSRYRRRCNILNFLLGLVSKKAASLHGRASRLFVNFFASPARPRGEMTKF